MSEVTENTEAMTNATDNGAPSNNKRRRVSSESPRSPDPEPQHVVESVQVVEPQQIVEPQQVVEPEQIVEPQQVVEPEQVVEPQQQLQKIMTSYTYAWRISGLIDRPPCQILTYIDSPRFTVSDAYDSDREYTCFLRFYGNGFDADTKGYISVRVFLVNEIDGTSNRAMDFQCKLSVLTKDNDEVLSQHSRITGLNLKKSQNYVYTFRKLIDRNVLTNNKTWYLHDNDDLVLLCHVGLAKYLNDISFEEGTFKFCTNVDKASASLHHAILQCYDLVFMAGGQRFHVHKNVINMRSPTFYTRLYSMMRGNIIIIEDMEAEDLSKIIEFIYKGTFSGSLDISEKLMILANEYRIDILKDICQDDLYTRVTVDNAMHLLVTAEQCDAYLLKENVMKFIVNHGRQIVETSGFKDLGQSYYELMKEIVFQLCAK